MKLNKIFAFAAMAAFVAGCAAPPAAAPAAPAAAKATDAPAAPPAADKLPDLAGKEISIAIENAYIPFNYVRLDNGKAEGWDYDAVGEICKRLNCKPKFVEIGWDNMIASVAQKQFDMAADGVTITADRAKTVDFSTGYMTVDQKIMVRIDDSRIKSVEDLKGGKYKIASQKGTTNFLSAAKMVGEDKVIGFDAFGDAVQALLAKDVDAVAVDDLAGQGYVGANVEKIKMIDGRMTDSSDQLGFVFPKGSALTPQVNAALKAMTDDGTLAKLHDKWFPKGQKVIADDKIGPGAYGPTATPKP